MTKIDLAIQADDAAVRADLNESPVSAPAAALEHTYFVVPTRFAVDGKELLAFPGVYEAWRPLPLLGFATSLRDATARAQNGEEAVVSLMDGGHLTFRRNGADVRITASLTGDEATVSGDRLADAATAFASEVCTYLLSVVPDVGMHPSWNTWCGDSIAE